MGESLRSILSTHPKLLLGGDWEWLSCKGSQLCTNITTLNSSNILLIRLYVEFHYFWTFPWSRDPCH